ncbi:MAG: hypothetical protein AAGA44_03540 [Pseudomonadota bacterium]
MSRLFLACLLAPLLVFFYLYALSLADWTYRLLLSMSGSSMSARPITSYLDLTTLGIHLLATLIAYVVTASAGLAIYQLLFRHQRARPLPLAVAGSMTALILFVAIVGIEHLRWGDLSLLFWMFAVPAGLVAVVFGRIAGFSDRPG